MNESVFAGKLPMACCFEGDDRALLNPFARYSQKRLSRTLHEIFESLSAGTGRVVGTSRPPHLRTIRP